MERLRSRFARMMSGARDSATKDGKSKRRKSIAIAMDESTESGDEAAINRHSIFGTDRPDGNRIGLLSHSKPIFKKKSSKNYDDIEENPPKKKEKNKEKKGGGRTLYTRRTNFCMTKDFMIDLANKALSKFNKNRPRQDKFKLVEALRVRHRFYPFIYHCNFTARPKKSTLAADAKLFFAEFKTEHEGKFGLHCSVCSELGPIGTETGPQGCSFCSCQHPADEEFIKKPLSPEYVRRSKKKNMC